jgi:plastocyanin
MRLLILAIFAFLCLLLVCANKPDDNGASRHEVVIKNLQFKPATIKVKVGQTVIWTNKDDRDHSIAAKDKSFGTDNLKPGQAYEYTFTKPGKYRYSCTYHPRMKGEVNVDK